MLLPTPCIAQEIPTKKIAMIFLLSPTSMTPLYHFSMCLLATTIVSLMSLLEKKCKLAYSQLGQHTCRAARDSEQSPLEAFKILVHAEYHSTLEDYDEKLYEHPMFDTAQPAIDPSNYSPKNVAQLHTMRMKLESNHNKLMDQMTQSGNHKGFEGYIQGDPKAMYYYLALKENPDIGNTVDSHLAGNIFADSFVGAVKKQTNTSKRTKSTFQARSDKAFEAVAVMVQVAQAKHQELGPYLDLRTQQMQQTATYIKQKKFAHAIEQLRLARKAKKELPDSASRSEKDEVDNLIRSWQQITNNWKKEMDTLETENAAGNRHSGKRKPAPNARITPKSLTCKKAAAATIGLTIHRCRKLQMTTSGLIAIYGWKCLSKII